jgi:hypothetical protein
MKIDNEEVQEEVEEIVEKTRIVPVTMIVAVAATLTVLAAFAVGVYQDQDTGNLRDDQGLLDDESLEALETPIDD